MPQSPAIAIGQTVTCVPLGWQFYCASTPALITAAATPTDVFTISGSASGQNLVVVTRILFDVAATAAGAQLVQVVKRSTANTGGTPTAIVGVARDNMNAQGVAVEAAQALVQSYTANPAALGTATPPLGGILLTRNVTAGALTAPGAGLDFHFSPSSMENGIVLRSAADVLAINLAGVAGAGTVFGATVFWLERSANN
jgi:hypothetical protein